MGKSTASFEISGRSTPSAATNMDLGKSREYYDASGGKEKQDFILGRFSSARTRRKIRSARVSKNDIAAVHGRTGS
jgi:hypothetical protein